MSQITRCPACRTSFRVVTDQLRISGGWVRCGRCKEVFDASANLLADVRYSPVPQHKNDAATADSAPANAPMAPQAPESAPAPVAAPVVTATPAVVAEPPPPAAPVATSSPSVLVPPTPAASFQQNVPARDERPNVWSNARASITGFSNASIQHLAQESIENKSTPAPSVASPSPAPESRPWAGNFTSSPAPQSSGYGTRRESNVVPPGWKPEPEAPKPVAHETPAAPQEKRVEPELVPSRLADAESSHAHEVAEREPEKTAAPSADAAVHAEPSLAEQVPTAAPHPVIISQDPELIAKGSEEDDDGEDMPELTFEASRQHELVDEPVLVAERDPDEVVADNKQEEVAAAEIERVEPTLEPVQDDKAMETPEAEVPAAAGNASESNDDKTAQAKTDEPQPEAAEQAQPVTPSEDEVGFMRDARRKAFWSKPAVRGVLVLVALGLLAGFAGQYAVAERNRLAATYPALRPVLEKLCQPLQCEVGLPRQIASVAIDSSTFTRIRDDATAFNLQVALKSNADIVLEMPALELTLTDSSDQPVLRRVLKREDTNAPAELAAHGEWNGVVKLEVPEVADRVTGYRLVAFYP